MILEVSTELTGTFSGHPPPSVLERHFWLCNLHKVLRRTMIILSHSYLQDTKLIHHGLFNSNPTSPFPSPYIPILKSGIHPSIGPVRCTTTREIGKRPRTIFQSARDKGFADARDLHRQEQLVEHEKRSEQLVPGSEYSTAVDIKECMLQVSPSVHSGGGRDYYIDNP